MNAFMGDSVASPTVWIVTIVVTVGVLLVDVLVIARRPHEPTMAEVSRHLAFFIGLAVIFGVCLWIFAEPHALSPNPGAGVLRRLADRVLAVGRQPVHLHHHHEQVRRTRGSTSRPR